MTASNTASALDFDNDTYRADETPQKNSLKFRFGDEDTVANGKRNNISATGDLYGNEKVRISNRFARKALRYTYDEARIIDDIKQRFSGVVTEIDYKNEEFTAQVSDLLCHENPDELVTLGFEEIQETDRPQLKIGDSFVWYIGYVQGQLMSREGFSKIRFRRFPEWSQREIEEASSDAKEFFNFFHGNTNTTA